MKKYFLYCGLYRSGNTLLSSILNQNKDICVTPNSSLCELMNRVNSVKEYDNYRLFPDEVAVDNILSNMFENYYQHLPQKYIIDRNGAWGTISNLELLEKYLPNKIKFIVTVRDILEILSSFCIIEEKSNNHNFLLEGVDNHCFNYRSKNDKICDFLMKPGEATGLDIQLFSLYKILENYKENVCLIEYKDLVRNPKKEIQKIYKFLNIPHFDHNFNEIKQYQYNGREYNDMDVLGVPLHTIRNKISRSKNNPYKVLSPYVIKKYSGLEFWRK